MHVCVCVDRETERERERDVLPVHRMSATSPAHWPVPMSRRLSITRGKPRRVPPSAERCATLDTIYPHWADLHLTPTWFIPCGATWNHRHICMYVCVQNMYRFDSKISDILSSSCPECWTSLWSVSYWNCRASVCVKRKRTSPIKNNNKKKTLIKKMKYNKQVGYIVKNTESR